MKLAAFIIGAVAALATAIGINVAAFGLWETTPTPIFIAVFGIGFPILVGAKTYKALLPDPPKDEKKS